MVVRIFCLSDAYFQLAWRVTEHCNTHPDGDKIHKPVAELCVVDNCEGFRISVIQAPHDYSLVQAAFGWHDAGLASRVTFH